MRKTLLILLSLVVCASNAFAWGQEGHRIVCRIGYDLLTPAERQKVDALVRAYMVPADNVFAIASFPDGCVFADEARSRAVKAEKDKIADSPWLHFKQFNNQHFLNVSRSTTTISEEMCHSDCVITAIATQSKALKGGATKQERAEGLIFLGHFVGDIHQPLHISYQEDQGGNLVRPVTGGYYPIPQRRAGETQEPQLNLHSVWDGGILRKALGSQDWQAFADDLRAKITDAQKAQWESSTPLQWAQESYDITTTKDLEYCTKDSHGCEPFPGQGRTLTNAYQDEFISVVDRRLEEAGVRLAALIHEALKP